MSFYRKVDVRVWGDERVRRLSVPKPNGRDCWLYLLTARETIILPGAIPASAAQLAESLRWTLPGFLAAFAEIEAQGMAKADWSVGLTWIPNAIRYNPPTNPNVAKGFGKAFDLLPECDLRTSMASEMAEFIGSLNVKDPEAFRKAFAEGLPKRLRSLSTGFGKSGSGSRSSSRKQEQQQDQEQEQKDLSHPARDRSEEAFPQQPVENLPTPPDEPARAAGHWGKVAEKLAVWILRTRALRGRFGSYSDEDERRLREWALSWCLKYQPDEAELEGMRCAFVGFLDDPTMSDQDHDARIGLWLAEGVWFERWGRERVLVAERRQRGAA